MTSRLKLSRDLGDFTVESCAFNTREPTFGLEWIAYALGVKWEPATSILGER